MTVALVKPDEVGAFRLEVPFRGGSWTDEQAERFVKLADDRSEKARARRLALLRDVPDLAAALGDLARQLEANLTHDLGALGDAARVHCENTRGRLGYDAAGEVERLIIDRIMLTWLHVNTLEIHRRRVWEKGATLDRLAWYDRQVSRAHVDHLRALTALARVRRLQVTIGQVNIAAGPQINQATIGADL